MSMTAEQLKQFEEAWSMHVCGPVLECECGKVYWDAHNDVYDWEPGERQRLEANKSTIALQHAVERIGLEGRIYCVDCDCWHKRAERIIGWLLDNKPQISEFYRLERRRLMAEAASTPEIEVIR